MPMALRLEDKKAIVAEVNEVAKSALSAVVADSRGVTLGSMTAMRKQAREAGVSVRVVRNTLAKRALAGTDFECLADTFKGPTLIALNKAKPSGAKGTFLKKVSLSTTMGAGVIVDQATLDTTTTA